MKLDMHIHTSRYSICSIISPEDIVSEAEAAGMEGIVITEHDKYWPPQEIRELKEAANTRFKIFSGQEVTTAAGHVLVFGCPQSFKYDIKVEELLGEIRKNGGVSFVSHPFRYIDIKHYLDSKIDLESYFGSYDGVEFLNGNQSAEQNSYGLSLYQKMKIPGIVGSDAHSKGMTGKFYTEFKNPVENEEELVEALKENQCRPGFKDTVNK